MRRLATLAGLSLALLLCVGQVSARENTSSTEAAPAPSSFRGVATVTGVADGDTLYADIEGHSIRIRLAQIDAPEKAQAFAVDQSSPCASWSGSAKSCCRGYRWIDTGARSPMCPSTGWTSTPSRSSAVSPGSSYAIRMIRLCLSWRRRRSPHGLGCGLTLTPSRLGTGEPVGASEPLRVAVARDTSTSDTASNFRPG